MPDFLDLAFLALFTVGLTAYSWRVGWSRMRRRIEAGVPGVRLRSYRTTIALFWTLTAAALLLIVRRGGDLGTILVVLPPEGYRRSIAIGIVAYATAVLLVQYWRIVRMDAGKRDAFRRRIAGGALILPRDREELYWFLGVSVTAGICEEILYRGFALWVLQRWTGFFGAAAISTVLFGLGHGYQGRKGVLRTAALAVVFVLTLVLCASLVPAIVIHIVLDVVAGFVGLTLFGARREVPATRAAA